MGKNPVRSAAGMAALVVSTMAPALRSQQVADWQTAAGGKLAFEVASVKLSKGAFLPPNVPLNSGDGYSATGGYFRADFPLSVYIEFAYKIWPTPQSREMFAHLPKWVTTDRYSIDARAAGNPTKDQLRLMVQSLLADRFQLAAHFATQEVPVFALTVAKDGKLGPKLISHADGRPCAGEAAAPSPGVPNRVFREDESGPGSFPPMCDSPAVIRKSTGMLLGYRNASMELLAGSLSMLVLDRPVIDKTGLSGKFDFTLEWAPSDSPAPPSDPVGPTPVQALRDQLGLKVESRKAPVPVLVIDRVERPSEN
jgi:bla regulator protein blaR1